QTSGVLLISAIDNLLRKARIHHPRRRLRNQNERMTVRPEMPPDRAVELATLRVRRTDQDQRTARRRQSRTQCAKNFLVGICAVEIPEGDLVANRPDARDTSNRSKRGRPDTDVDAARQFNRVDRLSLNQAPQIRRLSEYTRHVIERRRRLRRVRSQDRQDAALARSQDAAMIDA